MLSDSRVAALFHGLLPDVDVRLPVLEQFETLYGKTTLQQFRLVCRK